MQAKTKRILTVTVKRMYDESPDTSWLGEYSDRRTSPYSIDRAHAEDCASVSAEAEGASNQIQRVIDYLYEQNLEDRDAIDVLEDAQEQTTECDCSHYLERGSYRYFNPSFNYVDANGDALPENTPEDVRKYVAQDYTRMEGLNNSQWCFLGITAEAQVQVNGDVVQRIHSSGLWGIESDSDDAFFAEEEANQLAELKTELRAIGFSARAIVAAFRNVKQGGDCR